MKVKETVTRREFYIKEGFNHIFTYKNRLVKEIYLGTGSYYYLDIPKEEEEEQFMLNDEFPHKDKIISSDRYEVEIKPEVEEEMIEIPMSKYLRYEHWRNNYDYC